MGGERRFIVFSKIRKGFTFLEVMEDAAVSGWVDDLVRK
jgi:hypothetical protein